MPKMQKDKDTVNPGDLKRNGMDKITSILTDLTNEWGGMIDLVEKSIQSCASKHVELSRKEAELDKKEVDIKEREKLVQRKEDEIQAAWKKVRRDEDVAKQYDENMKMLEEIRIKTSDITEREAKVELKLEDVKKREMALSSRESSYQKEIEDQIIKSMFKNMTGLAK